MKKSAELFTEINNLDGIEIGRYEHGSNIYPMKLNPNISVEKFISKLREHSVFIYSDENNLRNIHLTVNTTILRQSNNDLYEAFKDALSWSRVLE